MSSCHNCQTPLKPENQYCPNCSQSSLSLTQPFVKIVSEAFHEVLDIDGRLAKTLKKLIFSPGVLSKEFMKGRRVSYTPPLRLYLVISLLFFIMISLLPASINTTGSIRIGFFLFPPGTLDLLPKLMIFMLPIYAALIKIFYRKSFFVGNLIFSLHLHCFIYLMFLIIRPLEQYESTYGFLSWLINPFWLYFALYPLIALKVMYERTWLYTIYVYIISNALYLLVLALSLEVIYSNFI